MARNREKKHESLVHQLEGKLISKLAIGQSKQEDKKAERALLKEKRKTDSKTMLHYEECITIHKIYSWGTFRDDQKHACYFVIWCKKNYGCKTLSECRRYVDEWLSSRSTLSAYTIKLEASALAKFYDCTTNDFAKTEVRHRSYITIRVSKVNNTR